MKMINTPHFCIPVSQIIAVEKTKSQGQNGALKHSIKFYTSAGAFEELYESAKKRDQDYDDGLEFLTESK